MTTNFAGTKHLAGCQCNARTCRAAYAATVDDRGDAALRRRVLARFETLLAMHGSVAEVSAPYARVETDGQVLIVQCTPRVLALLSAAGKLPPPPATPGQAWGQPRVRGGPRHGARLPRAAQPGGKP